FLFVLLGCGGAGGNQAVAQEGARPFAMTQVGDFEEPWAIAFMADGRARVTEKRGELKIWRPGGEVIDVAGVPEVAADGQGGALAPAAAALRLVYLGDAEPGEGGSGLALGRGGLVEADGAARIEDFRVLWRQLPRGAGGHFGAIIAFAPDGRSLFLSAGERQ